MSDCKNGGRGVPEPVLRLRVEFAGESEPWEYPLALNGRRVDAVYVGGVRYVPAPEVDWDAEAVS